MPAPSEVDAAHRRAQRPPAEDGRQRHEDPGRVVIPSAIRERARLTPGAELEITEDETGVRLERVAPGPRLVKVGRRLVARPTLRAEARTPLDLAAIVEEERSRWP
jgi:AbrB family looped-hinge helix DNA binding protein